MEHEAEAAGLPKAETNEACAFLVDGSGAVIPADGTLAADVFRLDPEAFVEHSLKDLLDPESPASRSAWASFSRREDFSGSLRLLRGDGSKFLADVSIHARNGDGSFVVRIGESGDGGSGSGDVRGAAMLRAVDFHLVEGSDGRISHVEPEAEKYLGKPPEVMVGETLAENMHPDDFAWISEEIEEVRRVPASTASVEARLWHGDGSWRHFEVFVGNLLADPNVGGFVWHFRDVSEKARVRGDIRGGEGYFRALVEGSRDMITLCSDVNTILYASPSYK